MFGNNVLAVSQQISEGRRQLRKEKPEFVPLESLQKYRRSVLNWWILSSLIFMASIAMSLATMTYVPEAPATLESIRLVRTEFYLPLPIFLLFLGITTMIWSIREEPP